MEYKKLMLILAITVTVIIMGLFGFSYAWYALSDDGTAFETSTNNPNLSVVFAQSQYINTTTGVPITASEVAEKSSKTLFSITTDAAQLAGYDVAAEISLVNINIDDSLKISDFHYALLETLNGTTRVVTQGTGATIGNNKALTLMPMTTITKGENYSYELRVWLQDSGVSQNELMQKAFSAKIQVSSALKK